MSIRAKTAAVSIACLCLAFGVQAATTGSITLSGNQPQILEITVSAEPGAGSLPLTTTVTDLKVGTVVERSNKRAGYTVTIASESAAASSSAVPSLRSLLTADFLPYTLKYGGKAVSFPGGAPAVISSVSAKTDSAGVENIVTVSFDGAAAYLSEAVYGDVLTFSIIAK